MGSRKLTPSGKDSDRCNSLPLGRVVSQRLDGEQVLRLGALQVVEPRLVRRTVGAVQATLRVQAQGQVLSRQHLYREILSAAGDKTGITRRDSTKV